MNEFWILIFVSAFAINSLNKTESVQLEETPLKIIDEIFGEGWWDNEKAKEWHKLTLEQNALHQIDRQNTQIGQIEPNSTDQLGQIEPNSTDQLGQIEPNSPDQLGQIEPNSTDQLGKIEPNSTDQLGQIKPNSTNQNHPLTESDHSENAKNGEEQNKIMKKKNIAENERKRKIVNKFLVTKDEFKQKGKYSSKEWTQIEKKIAKQLKVNRSKIYEWKKEFGLSRKVFYEKEERKHLIEKFDQMKAELKRSGYKSSYTNELDKTVAKKLGLSFRTIYNWKSELGQSKPKHKHSDREQNDLMKRYYEIKDQNPKIKDVDIAKMLKIARATLIRWKKQNLT